MMQKFILVFCLLIISTSIFSQNKAYQGVYYFTYGETDYSLLILIDNQEIYSQLRYYSWSPSLQKGIMYYQNFEDAKIDSNKFTCSVFNGTFETYKMAEKLITC